jgi:hypothetical protein
MPALLELDPTSLSSIRNLRTNVLANLGRELEQHLAHILDLLNITSILILDVLSVSCPSQPPIIVHGEKRIYVYDRSHTLHEEKYPDFTRHIRVSFNECPVS